MQKLSPSALLAVFALQALVACSGDSAPQTATAPGAQASATSGLRLNEIRFQSADGAPAFVEIANTGSAAISLDGASLRSESGASFELLPGVAIEPGALLVLSFDNDHGFANGVMHAPAAGFPARETGSVRLEMPQGSADAVTWGNPDLASVDLCRGGRCASPALGSVLARLPDTQEPFTPAAWALLDAELASPGDPNPRPPVSAFAAMPGMIFTGKPRFSWYSVPGAASYRLQVARDAAFASLVHEADIAATVGVRLEQLTAHGPKLPPGDYLWRVQALGASGASAPFSPPMPFSVDPSRRMPPIAGSSGGPASAGDRSAAGTGGGAARSAPGPNAPVELLKVLEVPVLDHAKDTRMLALEAPREAPLWSWDTPDLAGYPYCARAGVAMVNAYYGGKLSQDRIGYEVYKNLRDGPEYDLPVVGIMDRHTSEYSLPLAIGTSGEYVKNPYIAYGRDRDACYDYDKEQLLEICASQCVTERSEACVQCQIAHGDEVSCPSEIAHHWGQRVIEDIQREIDAGRPIIATNPSHLFLIVGYRLRDGDFSFFYQDEGGRQEVPANRSGFTQYLDSYWTGLAPIKVGSDEPEVKDDSDGDGVVDFDEIERFGTNPRQADSDGDGVNDKQEIRASVWDPTHGYHRTAATLPSTASYSEVKEKAEGANLSGRDFDRDNFAMELDPDSDGGGCDDGHEDANLDGRRDGDETSNFDKTDDDCEVALGGRIEMSYGFTPGRPPACKGNVQIRLRFQLEPEWGDLPEEFRTAIPPFYSAKRAVYEIGTEGCKDIVGGLFDFWGGANVACNTSGARRSGLIAFGAESNSGLAFFPLNPELSLVLPAEALLNPDGQCVYVDGRTSDHQVTHLGGEFLTVASGDDCETSTRYEYGHPPNLLDFCVEPNTCNVNASTSSETLAECYTHPERYAVIPFSGTVTKQGGILQGWDMGGNVFPIQVDDAHVRWEICKGCGNEYFEPGPSPDSDAGDDTDDTCGPPDPQRALLDTALAQQRAILQPLGEMLREQQSIQQQASQWQNDFVHATRDCRLWGWAKSLVGMLGAGSIPVPAGSGAVPQVKQFWNFLDMVEKLSAGDGSWLLPNHEFGDWASVEDAWNAFTIAYGALGPSSPQSLRAGLQQCGAPTIEGVLDGAYKYLDLIAQFPALGDRMNKTLNDARAKDNEIFDLWEKYKRACREYESCRDGDPSRCDAPPSS